MPINLLNLTPSATPAQPVSRHGAAMRKLDREAARDQAGVSDDAGAARSDKAHESVRADAPGQAKPKRDVHAADKAVQAGDKAGQAPAPDPFISAFKQAVALLKQVASDEGAKPNQAALNTVDPAAALALLAQFASLFPNMNAQPDAAGTQALAGIPAQPTGAAALTLDPQLLQALFGQSGKTGADSLQAGHLPLGQPLPPELQLELQHLQADMQALEQRLAAMMAAQTVRQPGDLENPIVLNLPKAADTDEASLAVTPVVPPTAPVMLVPPVNVANVPAAVEAQKPQTAISVPVSSVAAQRQAAIEMLLKPMRGELHIENGEQFALKGMRTDVSFNATNSLTAADGIDPMQQLVEAGKHVAMTLPEGEVSLATAMGIIATGDDGQPEGVHAGSGVVTNSVMAAALSAAPVEAVAESLTDGENPTEGRGETLKGEGFRAEEMTVGLHTLQSASGSVAVGEAGEGPRAQQAVMQQVIDTIKELAPGPAQVRMVLNPESLGQITVRLVSHQGQVSVRVLTENPEVQKMLDGGIGQLKAALAESGVRLDQIQVVTVPPQNEQRPDGQPQHRQPQPQAGHKGHGSRDEASAEELAALEQLNALVDGQGS